MGRPKVILDVDTGHDDACAIMMAGRSEALDLVAITVVSGNQSLDKTLRNTLNVCSELGIGASVYAGMDRPLIEAPRHAPRIHGESGLDGPVFGPCSCVAESAHAVDFLIKAARSAQAGTYTLVPTGPLTNVAMALRLAPDLAGRLAGIVLMGGSAGRGNVTPSAEFNILADPEAAAIVFSSGARVTMIGLDVTTTLVLDDERLARYRSLPSRAARLFGASMERYMAACRAYLGEFPAMHDPACVAYVSDPEAFGVAECRVDVELSGSLTRGRTVVDLAGVTGKAPNARVALTVDAARFWAMLESALRRYPD
jgi:ribosylpyrimidine nucleosidase